MVDITRRIMNVVARAAHMGQLYPANFRGNVSNEL